MKPHTFRNLLAILVLASTVFSSGCNIKPPNGESSSSSDSENFPEESGNGAENPDLQQNFSAGLEYQINADNSGYYVRGIGTCKDTEIVIPAAYNGKPVTAIGNYAFCHCTHLTSITIPEGVTSIGEQAFSPMELSSSLTTITIPDSIQSIGESAFTGCDSLQYNEYLNALYLGNESNPYVILVRAKSSSISSCQIADTTKVIMRNAFAFCKKLSDITIPESVRSIGKWVFSSCDALTSITVAEDNPTYTGSGNCIIDKRSKTLIAGCKNSVIPADGSVLRIGDNAFYFCGALTDITIPEGVTSIGHCSFDGCKNLSHISIPASVTEIGPSAFSGCKSLSTIALPETITKIGDYAFSFCQSLTDITIPKNITSIGNGTFFRCRNLTHISIPQCVISFGEASIGECGALKKITYSGSTEQWSRILKKPDWDKNSGNYKIRCTDGELDKEQSTPS